MMERKEKEIRQGQEPEQRTDSKSAQESTDTLDSSSRPHAEEKRFAQGLCFSKLFWIFMIGCVIGFIAETLYCIFIEHKFEFRAGLLYGPFNPVYGFGAVLITLVLTALPTKKLIWIFVISMLLGAGFEYVCSWFQELAFGTVSWQYEDTMWNIGGRTNLAFAFCWGILGSLWMAVIYPFLSRTIEKLPIKWGRILTTVFCIFMVFDLTISAMAAGRHTARREGIPAKNAIERFLDQVYPDAVMDKIYPNATPVDQTAASCLFYGGSVPK